MSKREASQIAAAAGVDIDAPRAKRRKDAAPDSKQSTGASGADAAKKEGEGSELPKRDSPAVVHEKGLTLWTVVKDAVDKEGRPLSVDFMRLPSKRQYPDYYVQIKKPIALDDIKAQLDHLAYANFHDIKHDLETCFRNAKRYNIRESQIFQDAKVLHKLVKKEYAKMTGTTEEAAEDDGEDHPPDSAVHEGGSDDEGSKKKKPPNMNRLLKTRLQKLVEKADATGRVLCTEFMELPNKKQWPIYYKTIKRPQCLESIFKRLKRKEYHTSQELANDVELVFSNALDFNQEHTEIWEDAMVLRDHFRHLMSDLPPPHTIPAYAESHPTKLKLKVPAPHHPSAASPPVPAPAQPQPVPGTLKIRAHHPTANGTLPHAPPPGEPSKSPSVPAKPSPAAASPIPPASALSVMPAPVPAVAQLKAMAPGGMVGPGVYPQTSYTPYGQYAHPGYQQPATTPSVTPATLAPAPSVSPVQAPAAPPAATAAPADPPSPPSDPQNHRTLKSVALLTTPRGRRLRLDHTDGVRTWAVRLVGETGVRVSGVRFFRAEGDDGESSDEEPAARKADDEEEYDGDAGERPKAEEAVKEKEEQKPEKRKRGRPPKKKKKHQQPEQEAVAGSEEAHAKEASPKRKGKAPAKLVRGEVRVKLNGVVVKSADGAKGEWELALPIGPSVVEIGEKGGTPWKVYLDRLPV